MLSLKNKNPCKHLITGKGFCFKKVFVSKILFHRLQFSILRKPFNLSKLNIKMRG